MDNALVIGLIEGLFVETIALIVLLVFYLKVRRNYLKIREKYLALASKVRVGSTLAAGGDSDIGEQVWNKSALSPLAYLQQAHANAKSRFSEHSNSNQVELSAAHPFSATVAG